LCGELLVLGHDGNRLACLEVLEDQKEEIVDQLWNCKLVPIGPDKLSTLIRKYGDVLFGSFR
jgi:hypothetical protein